MYSRYHVRVVRMSGNYGSIHGVPDETIEAMRESFEDWEGEELMP
jgi:hypothetical protein